MAEYWQLEESADQWQLEESTDLWELEESGATLRLGGLQAIQCGMGKYPGLQAIRFGITGYPSVAPAAGGLVVDAADFDGSTYLSRAAYMANGSQVSIVVFVKKGTEATDKQICTIGDCYLDVDPSGLPRLTAYESGFGKSLTVTSTISIDDGSWHSICVSVDTNFSAGNKLYSMRIDRTLDTPTVTDSDAAFTINLNSISAVGSTSGGSQTITACLAEISADAQYIDFSNSTNLDKFVTAANKPENIGADGSTAYGAACALYLHLDDAEAAANFALNAGTGGNFTVTGTLTTCASSPSD